MAEDRVVTDIDVMRTIDILEYLIRQPSFTKPRSVRFQRICNIV
jgi:hypothetical protein